MGRSGQIGGSDPYPIDYSKLEITEEAIELLNSERLNVRSSYRLKRTEAKNRGIDFEFTYEEFINLWFDCDDIGIKWLRKGNKKNDLVIARYGDKGPYSINNVRIATQSENVKEYIYNNKEKRDENLLRAGLLGAAKVSRKVKINGIVYNSFSEACREIPKLHYVKLMKMVNEGKAEII